MPSPTSRTRPTSRVSSLARYWSISFVITETISSALNLMTATLHQLFAEHVEPGAHRTVEQPVAHAQDEAAEDAGIDGHVQQRLQFKGSAQVVHQALLLVLGKRHGRAHLDAKTAVTAVVQQDHFPDDGPQQGQTFVFVQDQQE